MSQMWDYSLWIGMVIKIEIGFGSEIGNIIVYSSVQDDTDIDSDCDLEYDVVSSYDKYCMVPAR